METFLEGWGAAGGRCVWGGGRRGGGRGGERKYFNTSSAENFTQSAKANLEKEKLYLFRNETNAPNPLPPLFTRALHRSFLLTEL